jgi:hypothetical protein
MDKLYLYQTPRETYYADRRKAYDPKYVSRTWQTQFNTTDYNEILEYINGQTVVGWDADGTEHYNEIDPIYRVLEQTVVVQEGELVSPFDDLRKETFAKSLSKESQRKFLAKDIDEA